MAPLRPIETQVAFDAALGLAKSNVSNCVCHESRFKIQMRRLPGFHMDAAISRISLMISYSKGILTFEAQIL